MAVLALSCFGRRMTVARFCCRCCCCVRCATCVFGQLFSPAAGGVPPIQQATAAACMSCCAGEPKRVPRNTHVWSCCAGEPSACQGQHESCCAGEPSACQRQHESCCAGEPSACDARHGCDNDVKWERSACGRLRMCSAAHACQVGRMRPTWLHCARRETSNAPITSFASQSEPA